MGKNFCLLSRRAVVYGLINRNLSLPRLWTLYWKQGLIRPRKPVSPQHANKTILFGQFVEKRESMQTNNKMAVAPVGKLIWQMSIPPLISMFLQYSYNLIDSAFVARLSENALTAVSLSFPITTLMNATSIWIGVGVNVLIAGYLGEKSRMRQILPSHMDCYWPLELVLCSIFCHY